MKAQTETTFVISDADPYLRIEASRYETSFCVVSTDNKGNSGTSKIKLPKASRGTMLWLCLQTIANLRHADCDDRALALEILREAQGDVHRALQQLDPQPEPTAESGGEG